jgi:hypothetical protein
MSNATPSNRAALFVAALAGYIGLVQTRVDAANAKAGDSSRTYPDRVRVKQGSRFVAVFTQNRDSLTGALTGDPVIHSFVDKLGGKHAGETNQPGAVLYPTSDLAPAKHERGNIFNDDKGASALVADGYSVRELPRGRGTGGGRTATFIDGDDLAGLTAAITVPEPEVAATA